MTNEHKKEDVAGVTETGEAVTPAQAVEKLRAIFPQEKGDV